MKTMLKRLMSVGFFGVMAVAMLQPKAAEAGAVYVNGIIIWVGSIRCESFLKALSKKDAPFTLVTCDALIETASFRCVNNGGNADTAFGSHIFAGQDTTVSVSTTVSSCQLNKITGTWDCNQTIGDATINDALEPLIPPDIVCPNRNFTVQVGTIIELCPTISVFSCVNTATGNGCTPDSPNCNCSNLEDTVIAKCSVPDGSPSGTKYDCTEIQSLQQCVF